MPIPTPFHSRTAVLCESYEWRNWAGYLAAGLYEQSYEREYFAIRNSAAMIDVSPLFKYEISGPDAAHLVDRIITRDVSKYQVGQVLYSPWCDEEGKVIDDGTIDSGMIPKVQACLETLGRGVGKVHIIDGRLRHSLLLEIYTTKGVGTQIINASASATCEKSEVVRHLLFIAFLTLSSVICLR